MRARFLTVVGAFSFAIISILAVPVILGNSDTAPICSINQANAQDNPCLAQEATNSALELQILEDREAVATVLFEQEAKFQATVTALESSLANQGPAEEIAPAPAAPGLPFVEAFDDNSHGWDLTENEDGVARLSQGQLLVTVRPSKIYWQPIPGLLMESDSFYVEVVASDLGRGAEIGFGLGDADSREYHRFSLYGSTVYFYDNESRIFATEYSDIRASNDSVVIGLEVVNGLYTLYVDGIATDSAQLSSYGNQIGILFHNNQSTFNGRSTSAAFDNLVVRASP